MRILKEDKYSKVWRDGPDWVYKRQHEFLTDNEYWCLTRMYPSGFVPKVEKLDRDLIRTCYIQNGNSYSADTPLVFLEQSILAALAVAGIRHGDLTKYSVLIDDVDGHPYIIDFAESRLWSDPRPDKRPEGDAYWLHKTMKGYVDGTT